MNLKLRRKNILYIAGVLLFGFLLFFLDKVLAIGVSFLILLFLITFLMLFKIGLKDRMLFRLLFFVILVHLIAVLFIHYANFQPFSGGEGDYKIYQQQAQEISQRLHQWNFSLKGLGIGHYYPVIIGWLYAFTLPEMFIGQLFGVWLAVLSIIFVYFIVLEISDSKVWAFLIGLIASVYPSYLFYGSLLLKDTLIVPLVLGGLLIIIQLIKNFSWKKFIILYIILTGLTHFRFYIGYALIITFIFCWLFLGKLNLKKKIIYAIIIIPILGFLPQFFNYGYYGINSLKYYLTSHQITFYREIAYSSSQSPAPQAPAIQSPAPQAQAIQSPAPQAPAPGLRSSICVGLSLKNPLKFIENYFKSFIYVLLGPLPWQIKYKNQLFILIETIPWYFLIFFIGKGIINSFKRYRTAIPLIVFSFGVFAVLALFLSNFGIVTRIRMPAFISLLALIPLGFIGSPKDYLKNRKVKICWVTNIDKSIKIILLPYLKFLRDLGYEIYTVFSPTNSIKEIEAEGIKVKTIKISRKISPISDLVTLFKLFLYFKKENFDFVHTNTPKPGLLGQLAAKMAGTPVIINTIHGFYFQKEDFWLKRKFFILIEKIAASCSSLIFSVNKEDIGTAIKEKICKPSLIKYLGNGINLSRFNPDVFSQEFIKNKKKELNIDPKKKVIGIVARLVKEKGYLDLFEAFKIVLKRFPDTLLLIIGYSELEKKDGFSPEIVKNFVIEKNTLFVGERKDVEELYFLMDIFVLPSLREGLGLSILEASAMKRPVVATDIRGCREAVKNGETGILVPPRNPEKLAEAIIYLLSNSEEAKEMGQRGRKKVEEEFDERIIFDRIKKEYQRLIEERLKWSYKKF